MSLVKIKHPKKRIRNITVSAFYARLDTKLAVLLAIADQLVSANGDYTLKAKLMQLDKSEFANLDDQRLKQGLLDTGQFTETELDDLFSDGTEEEVPEIFKKV
jgi:hypothetical protein